MRVQIDAQLRRALHNIFPIDTPGEGLVLHLFAYARHFNVGDRLGRLDQRARGQETGQFVAGEQAPGEMRHPRHSSVLGMAENRGAQFLRPALPFEFAHAHHRMLRSGGVPLVVEIVQKCRCRVKLNQRIPFLGSQSKPLRLGLSAGGYAGLDGKGVLAQAFALGPLGQQLPGPLTVEREIALRSCLVSIGNHAFITSLLRRLVRLISGFYGLSSCYLP